VNTYSVYGFVEPFFFTYVVKMRFWVLTVAGMKMGVFWYVVVYNLVEID
jgi:hypothetical protein